MERLDDTPYPAPGVDQQEALYALEPRLLSSRGAVIDHAVLTMLPSGEDESDRVWAQRTGGGPIESVGKKR